MTTRALSVALGLALFAAGCALNTADYRVDQAQRIIWARTPHAATVLCAKRGVNRALACYDARDDVIVLPEGEGPGTRLWEHEWCHRRNVGADTCHKDRGR